MIHTKIGVDIVDMKKIVIIVLGILFVLEFILIAGEWNEKPVMCAGKKETFDALQEKKEVMLFSGLEYAKVRSETGYKIVPAKLPFWFYANIKTGTYTVIEYHPDYSSYCVIAFGVHLQNWLDGRNIFYKTW